MSPIPMSSELETDAGIIDKRHAIHEYAFGIISSDSKGLSTIVSISEPYKKHSSGSSTSAGSCDDEEDLLNSVAFNNWSMSSYQQSACSFFSFHEDLSEDVDHDEFQEDNNNNITSVRTNRLIRRHSDMKEEVHSRAVSKPRKIPQLVRRWSGGSVFGGTPSPSPPTPRVLPVDPDMPSMETPPESWYTTITQIPDMIRKHRADKNRFNVNSVPREKLKQLHCY